MNELINLWFSDINIVAFSNFDWSDRLTIYYKDGTAKVFVNEQGADEAYLNGGTGKLKITFSHIKRSSDDVN